MTCCVYKITNIINGDIYIGSTVNSHIRFRVHKRSLLQGKHHSGHLQNAYNIYGIENFVYSIVECCSEEKIREREQYYINILKPRYNIQPTVGSSLGLKHTEETKLKISKANKGRILTQEHKDNIKKNHGKVIYTDELRKKFSVLFKGRKKSKETIEKMKLCKQNISDETRKKLSIASKGRKYPGRKLSAETIQKIKDSKKNISQETRNKLSEATKAAWERVKKLGKKEL